MMNPVKSIRALLTSIVVLSALGCESKTTTYSFPVVHWRSQGDDAAPGIDHAVVFTSVVNDQLVFVVWTDIENVSGLSRVGSRLGPSSDGALKYEMSIRRNELFIPIQWRTKDEKTGIVKISGEQFQMDEGNWFLVSTHTDPVKVRQLKRNPSKKRLTDDEFRELARTDEDIAEFFRKAAEQQ